MITPYQQMLGVMPYLDDYTLSASAGGDALTLTITPHQQMLGVMLYVDFAPTVLCHNVGFMKNFVGLPDSGTEVTCIRYRNKWETPLPGTEKRRGNPLPWERIFALKVGRLQA